MRRQSSPPALAVRSRTRGYALLLMLVILTIGILASLVGQLSVVGMKWGRAQRDTVALQEAKEALIGYAATYRDTTSPNTDVFGYLPCPDTNGDGVAEPSCDSSGITVVGMLPYKTLKLADLRDDANVCLWYAVSGNFKNNPPTAPLNWDTQGQIKVVDANGNTLQAPDDANGGAAAVIIATGRPLSGQSRSTSSYLCGAVPSAAQIAAYLDGSYTFPSSSTVTLTEGSTDSATNNDLLLAVTPREIFDRIISRSDFKNLATISPAGQINSLANSIKIQIEKQMQTDLGAAGPPPTGIAQPEQTGYTQYSGKLIGDLSTSLSLTGASDTNYLTNWRNQFRYAVCNSLSTACLNIAGTSCRAALLFGGRSTGGGPRTSTQNTSSTANLDYFFEAGKGREILTSANTSFLGNTSYYSPTASAAEDVATCLFPGSFVSFSQNISNFSSGLTKSGTGSNALAAVNTVSKTVTLGSSSVTTGSVGCIWNASTVETKSLLRLYFRLNFTTKGNGLMLALADGATNLAPNNASRTQIMCGAQGSTTMGYSGVPPADASNTPPAGTSAGIKSPKIGLEFDTRYDSSRADPYTDHVAFDYWGSSSDNSLVSANNCVTNPAGDNCGTDDNTHYVGVGGVGVTAAAWGSHVVTVTTASPHGFADNQVVIVSGMSPDAYNGTYSIHVAGLSSTQFTYNLTNDPGTLTTKGMVVPVAAGSGPRNPRVATALRNVTVTSASWSSTSGGRVTINTTSPNNLVSGQKVYVSGISPAGYNGVYTVIASGLSASRFRYLLTANPGTYVSGGTVPAKESEVSTLNGSSSTVTAITTPTTHGFSTGQSVTVAGATPNGFDISGSITNNGASTSFSYPSLTDLTGITFAKESLAGMFLLKKSTTAPYKYLKYSSIPTATNIFVRLDISRTYDNTNHIALLNLKAYIGDTFGSLLTDGDICTSSTDFQDLTQDVAKLCPLRTVTLQQDSIPISALATLSAASWSSGSQLVTATTAAAHGLVNGATVTISGVKIPGDGPTAYNGTYPIIVTSANTFTYSVTSNPGSYLSGGDVEPMTSVYLGFTNSRSGTTTVEDQSATIDQLILRSQ